MNATLKTQSYFQQFCFVFILFSTLHSADPHYTHHAIINFKQQSSSTNLHDHVRQFMQPPIFAQSSITQQSQLTNNPTINSVFNKLQIYSSNQCVANLQMTLTEVHNLFSLDFVHFKHQLLQNKHLSEDKIWILFDGYVKSLKYPWQKSDIETYRKNIEYTLATRQNYQEKQLLLQQQQIDQQYNQLCDRFEIDIPQEVKSFLKSGKTQDHQLLPLILPELI